MSPASAPTAPKPAGAPSPAPSGFRWVPIRSLSERHRPRILAHLLSLDEQDRHLRFGHTVSDLQIGRYVDAIDFEQDEVFGVFNRKLELIALAHLAYLPPVTSGPPAAEFGVSVLPKARGRGYGSRLFHRAVLHARNRGIQSLVIHALSENTAMLRIVRAAGATIQRQGPESQANLKLPADDMASHLGAWFESSAAEIDFHLKRQARNLDDVLDALHDVRERVGKSGQTATE